MIMLLSQELKCTILKYHAILLEKLRPKQEQSILDILFVCCKKFLAFKFIKREKINIF